MASRTTTSRTKQLFANAVNNHPVFGVRSGEEHSLDAVDLAVKDAQNFYANTHNEYQQKYNKLQPSQQHTIVAKLLYNRRSNANNNSPTTAAPATTAVTKHDTKHTNTKLCQHMHHQKTASSDVSVQTNNDGGAIIKTNNDANDPSPHSINIQYPPLTFSKTNNAKKDTSSIVNSFRNYETQLELEYSADKNDTSTSKDNSKLSSPGLWRGIGAAKYKSAAVSGSSKNESRKQKGRASPPCMGTRSSSRTIVGVEDENNINGTKSPDKKGAVVPLPSKVFSPHKSLSNQTSGSSIPISSLKFDSIESFDTATIKDNDTCEDRVLLKDNEKKKSTATASDIGGGERITRRRATISHAGNGKQNTSTYRGSKKQASTTLINQRKKIAHSSFIHNNLLSKTNDGECNKLVSQLNTELPGPPLYGDDDKDYWAWRLIFFRNKLIGSARGRLELEKLIRLMRGGCSANYVPTAKQIVNGQNSIDAYKVMISLLSQLDYKKEYGDNDGLFPCQELTDFQTNETKVGKSKRTITYLALTDDDGGYDERSAVMAFSNYQLYQISPDIIKGMEDRFCDLFRHQTKIPHTRMPLGNRVVPAKGGPFELEDYVLDQVEFDTVEDATEYMGGFDEQGYSITNKGKETLDKLYTPTGQLTVKEEGCDITHTFTSSRNALEFMKGGGASSNQRKTFDAHLETVNLHMTKTVGNNKHHFVNPTEMEKDVVIEKDQFGFPLKATYIINGVLV